MGWAITQTWHLVEKDVEDTLEAIGERVLAEKGVEPAVLRRRAEGMRAISEVFRVRRGATPRRTSEPRTFGRMAGSAVSWCRMS